jgi:hypothetical protein
LYQSNSFFIESLILSSSILLSIISQSIPTSSIKGLSIYGLLSFQAGLVKISHFLALVIATKNNLLSSSEAISLSKFFCSFSDSQAYCNHSQTIQIGNFNLSETLLLSQFQE